MSQAGFAHGRGDGLDGGQHGVDELGQLTGRPLSLAARLHDEPGQGPYVRVKGRLVRHVWSVCSGQQQQQQRIGPTASELAH